MSRPTPAGTQTVVVLIVDPDPLNQRALRDKLVRMGFNARSADDAESAQAIIDSTPPDVVLATYAATQSLDWRDLEVKLNSWGIPMLSLGQSALPIGASPGISDQELKSSIGDALNSRKLQDALAAENARLAAERLFDPITGLFNRRYMIVRIEEEIKRSARQGYPLSCLIIDIDKFDTVNERLGHHTGDTVLRNMAHVITRTMRATDIVARYRDDEFIALLTDTDAAGAQVAANRLRDAVAGFLFNAGTGALGGAINLTASVGVAYWEPSQSPGEGTWEPQLIGLAERALKAAKQSGPNRMVMLQAS